MPAFLHKYGAFCDKLKTELAMPRKCQQDQYLKNMLAVTKKNPALGISPSF